MADRSAHAPIRALGTLSLAAISVNTVIGAGIFSLPGTIAHQLGSASLVAYLVAGVAGLLIALCFAEAGSQFDSTGGPYVYARAAFGDFAGFQAAWLFLLARVTAVGAVANTFADYLGFFWPAAQHGAGRMLVITCMIVTLGATHWFGVRPGAAVNNAFCVAKLLPLLSFCVAGSFFAGPRFTATWSLPGSHSLQQASLLVLFALGGFENATIPSEEAVNPRKSLPTALLVSVSSVAALYIWIQAVAMAALPGLAGSATPLASAASAFLGPAGGMMLTLGAVVSTAGSNHVNLFIGPRVMYALALDGNSPAALAKLHPRYRTPWLGILVYAAAGWLLAVSSAFGPLAALSALTRVLVYGSACLAVPVLRRQRTSQRRTFTLPGAALLPVAGLAVCIWLLIGASAGQAIAGAAALLGGALLYALVRPRAPGARAAVPHRGPV